MPRFYMHVMETNRDARDEEGIDLPNIAAARKEAFCSAREIIASEIMEGKDVVAFCIHVDDEMGAEVMEIPILATVTGLKA